MKNLNACLASLNLGLPDDVRRLKEAGYYTEAIACIDTYLAEDWTKTQNQPVQPAGPLPENPTPHGVDAMRDALLAQREILRRLPLDYTVPEAQALELLAKWGDLTEKYDCTMAQLVIAMTARMIPGLHVLCGARKPEQVLDNAGALHIKLDGADAVRMKWDVDAIS